MTEVPEFDAALSREYLGVLEQAAKEMGGKLEEAKPNGDLGERPQVNINFPVLSDEQIAEIDNAKVIDLHPGVRRLLKPSKQW